MSQPVKVHCPGCKAKVRVPSLERLERGVKCPACGKRFSRHAKPSDGVPNAGQVDVNASQFDDSDTTEAAPEQSVPSPAQDSPGSRKTSVKMVVGAVAVLAAAGVWLGFGALQGEQPGVDPRPSEGLAVPAVSNGGAGNSVATNPAAPNTTLVGTTPTSTDRVPNRESTRTVNASQATPQPRPAADMATYRDHVQPFLAKHCVDCHGPDLAEGKLRLDTIPADFFTRQSAAQWVEVLDRLNLGEMPPEDEARPDADELARVTDWITTELAQVQSLASSTGGRIVLRRLTRSEYTNTVRDLFGITFFEGEGPQDMLPPDGSIKGFNKLSKALLLDPSLMEKYVTVAQYVVEKAIATRPPKAPSRTIRFDFENTPGTPMGYIVESRHADATDEGMILYTSGARTFGELRHPFNNASSPECVGEVRLGEFCKVVV